LTGAIPIRLVAFDWGGVILRHHRSWAEACGSAGIEVRAGHERPELIAQRRALNLSFQCGKMTPEEFYPKMAEATGGLYSGAEVRRIHEAWLTEEYPGVDGLVRRLVALPRVETALLSNTNECHWARMKDFPTAGLLKHRHASHLLGHAKPGVEIFRVFEREVGFSGAEILFFDDLLENVSAAVELGWRAELIDHAGDTAGQVAGHLARYGVW
jgi:HAD superfamily hydrolase (TIGR01509 family)